MPRITSEHFRTLQGFMGNLSFEGKTKTDTQKSVDASDPLNEGKGGFDNKLLYEMLSCILQSASDYSREYKENPGIRTSVRVYTDIPSEKHMEENRLKGVAWNWWLIDDYRDFIDSYTMDDE